MSRQEFLQRLRETLLGEVPPSVIEENIRYYDEYIRTEVQKGSSEEAVTASIGDPRLIARTIMDATENAEEGSAFGGFYQSYSDNNSTAYEENTNSERRIHFIDLSKWYWKLLGVLVLILFFFLLASIVTGIFAILAPIIGPLLLVLLVVWFVKGIRR